MKGIANSLLLWARARITPCPQQNRSWRRRFEVRGTESVFVLSSWYRGLSITSMRLSKKKLPEREACEDDGGPMRRMPGKWNVPIRPAQSSKAAAINFIGNSGSLRFHRHADCPALWILVSFVEKSCRDWQHCHGNSQCYCSGLQPEMHRDSSSPICAGSSTAAL